MKKLHLAVLSLALSSALISGCAEKKEATEKPKEAALAPVEAVAQKPAEPEPPVARVETEIKPEKAASVKEQAKAPVKKAAPAKEAAPVEAVKAVEKAVVEKEAAAVVAVKTAEKAVEEKAVAAEKAVEKALTPTAAGDAAAGAVIFKMKCAPCHGAEGKGTAMAPALKDSAWVKAASVADITGVIKNGRQGKAKKYANFFVDMPASKAMPESDLAALAAYLKSLN